MGQLLYGVGMVDFATNIWNFDDLKQNIFVANFLNYKQKMS